VCGGTYFTSKGSLQSPNYPNFYPSRKDCTWIIYARAGQQIKLNVTDFSLSGGSRCQFDYLEIRCVLITVSVAFNFNACKWCLCEMLCINLMTAVAAAKII
jgi:hypothetical protein